MRIKVYIHTNEKDSFNTELYVVPRVGEILVIRSDEFIVTQVIHTIETRYTLGSIIIKAKKSED